MSLTEAIAELTRAGCTIEFHEMPSESGPHLNCVVVGFGHRIGRTILYRDIDNNAGADAQIVGHLKDAARVLSRTIESWYGFEATEKPRDGGE